MLFAEDPSFFVGRWTEIGEKGVLYRFRTWEDGYRCDFKVPFWLLDGSKTYSADYIRLPRGCDAKAVRRVVFAEVYWWETEGMQG